MEQDCGITEHQFKALLEVQSQNHVKNNKVMELMLERLTESNDQRLQQSLLRLQQSRQQMLLMEQKVSQMERRCGFFKP